MTRHTRSLLLVSVAALALFAGCTGTVNAPETVDTAAADGYEFEDVSSWTGGSLFEYGDTLVVTGTLRSTADAPQPIPRIEARVNATDGWTRVAATYRPDRRQVGYDAVRNSTLAAGESIDFRIVWTPDRKRTVTNVTVRTG
jgi:hypothetical protein